MASYDSGLGMWKGRNGQYYSTREEAQAAEANYIDDGDYIGAGGGIAGQAPDAVVRDDPRDAPNPLNPGGISDKELERRQNKLRSSATATANINADRRDYNAPVTTEQTNAAYLRGNTGGASGAYNSGNAASRANYDYMHELGSDAPLISARGAVNRLGERAGISHAGDVANPGSIADFSPSWSPEALFQRQFDKTTDPNTGLGQTLAGDDGNGGRPVVRQGQQTVNNRQGVTDARAGSSVDTSGVPDFEQGQGRTGIDKETADAGNRAGQVIEENRDENANLFANAFDQYENISSDNTLSDEARGYQREGLQQQRQLLQKMLGFDADQYASKFADQALSRQIAASRSAGGGAAAQQAGMFAAMEQGPSLYAEGARQASGLESQRLATAETAAKAFGDLGTMTRGQDENRAQFESNLSLGIADSVARLTEGNVQMNDRDSAQMAEIWMDFAKLQSVYAGMTSDEQLAWWQNETARRGQDKNFEAIMEQMKNAGKVSSKDLIGGLFQLGGGVLSAGGSLGNAYMQGQTARDVANINAGNTV